MPLELHRDLILPPDATMLWRYMDFAILMKEHGQRGIEVPFSTARFVTEVVIGPREGRWVATLVESVLKRYGLTIKPTISNRLTAR